MSTTGKNLIKLKALSPGKMQSKMRATCLIFIYFRFMRDEVFISVVACGERLEETLTMIKSALIFNKMDIFEDERCQHCPFDPLP